jgi:uncharacterized protein YndB with AHSA1/START domain
MRAVALAAPILVGLALIAATATAAEPAATRGFEVSGVIPARPAAVWQALTTAEGWRRMGVPFAVVDFRIGGTIETSYSATAHPGQPDNIKNQVAAFIPGRMIALRNVQAPPSFPYPAEFATTATVFELMPAGHGATRLTVTGVGYGQGPAYDWLLDKFKEGDAWTLKELADSFAGKAQAPAKSAPSFTRP